MSETRTLTASESQTFTIADAKYLASRVAADLTQIRLYYGHIATSLTDEYIQKLAVEVAMLLKFGLLRSAKYGFRKDNEWRYFVSYTVNDLGQLELSNDSPGDIEPNAPVQGATWYSYTSTKHNPNMTSEEEEAVHSELPIQRTAANEPSSANGTYVNDKSYYRNGTGMQRGQFLGASYAG